MLAKGTRVRTISVENPPTDWNDLAQKTRRFNSVGTVLAHHDSHGLCYEIRHDDGVVSAYEPQELELL